MKTELIGFLFLLQQLVAANAVPAKVINDEAIVYRNPDFDSEQLSTYKQDTKIEVSKKNFGPFHRVRMKNGTMGYIVDNDFVFQGLKNPTPEKKPDQKQVVDMKCDRKSRAAEIKKLIVLPEVSFGDQIFPISCIVKALWA